MIFFIPSHTFLGVIKLRVFGKEILDTLNMLTTKRERDRSVEIGSIHSRWLRSTCVDTSTVTIRATLECNDKSERPDDHHKAGGLGSGLRTPDSGSFTGGSRALVHLLHYSTPLIATAAA